MIKTILYILNILISSIFPKQDKSKSLHKQEKPTLLTSEAKVVIILGIIILIFTLTVAFTCGSCTESGNYYYMMNRGI